MFCCTFSIGWSINTSVIYNIFIFQQGHNISVLLNPLLIWFIIRQWFIMCVKRQATVYPFYQFQSNYIPFLAVLFSSFPLTVCDSGAAFAEYGLPTQEPARRAVAECPAPQSAQYPSCHDGPGLLWHGESTLLKQLSSGNTKSFISLGQLQFISWALCSIFRNLKYELLLINTIKNNYWCP